MFVHEIIVFISALLSFIYLGCLTKALTIKPKVNMFITILDSLLLFLAPLLMIKFSLSKEGYEQYKKQIKKTISRKKFIFKTFRIILIEYNKLIYIYANSCAESNKQLKDKLNSLNKNHKLKELKTSYTGVMQKLKKRIVY